MDKTNNKLSAETQSSIIKLLAEGHSKRSIGRMLDIGESTVRKYATKFGIDALSVASESDDAVVQLGRQVARQAEALKKMRTQVKAVNERGFGYDDFITAMERLIEVEKNSPFTYYPTTIQAAKRRAPIEAIDKDHVEDVVLALSDWHLTEVVRGEDSNGINRYNTMIASNRLWTVVQKFKRIVQMHRAMYGVRKVVLLVLGDLISGSIHEEFLTSNDGTDQVAQIIGVRLLRMVIMEIKALGLPIEVHCIIGNHPRTTKKMPTKNIAHTNLEWVIYEFTKQWFEDDKQIKFNVYTSQFKRIEIFDHAYIIEHGIGWKNGQEENSESELRDLLDDSIYREATGLQGTAFKQIVIGNLHKPAFLERTVKNGSLIGQNELGQQWKLRPIRAQQLMWGVSKTHARTFQYALDVTGQWNTKPDNPFSEFAHKFMADHGRYQTL